MTKLAAKVQIKRECHGCNCVGIDLGCQYMNQNVKICESDEDRMRSLAIEKISVTIDQSFGEKSFQNSSFGWEAGSLRPRKS